MKLFLNKYLLLFLLGLSIQPAHSQIMYRSRYKSAILLEGFGLSPIMSANYEFAPIRYQKSYFSGRVGLGYMPASLNNGAGISFPVGASYNILLNNLKKGIQGRLMNRCKSLPPKIAMEYFLETGPGYSLVVYPSSKTTRSYFNALVALKTQIYIDIPPKVRVITLKVSINPLIQKNNLIFLRKYKPATPGDAYTPSTPEQETRFYGGFALGFSL